MKKILLLLFLVYSYGVFGQLTENFEGSTFPPTGWITFETGTGSAQSWSETTNPLFTYQGVGKSAFINRENVLDGTFAIDWLVSPAITVPSSPQLRFQTKTLQSGTQGGIFEIRISNASQTNPNDFVVVQSWDENSLTSTSNIYEEKVIDLSSTSFPQGSQIFIAFVYTNDNGDRWLVDNINLIQKCDSPNGALNTQNISAGTTQLSWSSPVGVTNFDIEICPFNDAFGGASTTTYNNVTNPFVASGLSSNILYKFQVRSVCSNGFKSDWYGPKSFQTALPGELCNLPIAIANLPYSNTNNTSNFDDVIDIQPNSCFSFSGNYLLGNDVFYTFTPSFTGTVQFNVASSISYTSLTVYNGCSNVGVACLGGALANTPLNLSVVSGNTYVVLISSGVDGSTVGYTLTLQQVTCTPPSSLTVNSITQNSANIAWSNLNGASSWEYAIAPYPYALPTGNGNLVTTTSNLVSGLMSNTKYQYYVRASCNNGTFSLWSGPFTFTTLQQPATLNYLEDFETTNPQWTTNEFAVNSLENKWVVGNAVSNGGSKSLYITKDAGISNSYNNGAFSSSVSHAYRDVVVPAGTLQVNLTFDWRCEGEINNDFFRVWVVPTSFTPTIFSSITASPQRVLLTGNLYGNSNFSTSSYTINAAPFAGSNMRIIFEWKNDDSDGVQPPAAIDNINLSIITCPKPTSLTASSVTLNSANLSWINNIGTANQWEVIVQPASQPVPSINSSGILTSTTSYNVTGLNTATCYDYYVRGICGVNDVSTWAGPFTFCTTADYCGGEFFTDPGGANGDYLNNLNVTTTICPNSSGDLVTVIFSSFDLVQGDFLKIYNGPSTSSPLLGNYTSNVIPPSFSSTHPSGCLTFVFTSNGAYQSAGWIAKVFCTPPQTCPKPNLVTSTVLSQTAVQLSWNETGTASQWEIFYTPYGASPPLPGSLGITVNTNSYILNGLLPGKAYTYYVRSICSSTNRSFWSEIPNTFATLPVNDEPVNAILTPVNAGVKCIQSVNGTLTGGTGTSLSAVSCNSQLGTIVDDVWFKFVATANAHIINVNFQSNTALINFGVYTGPFNSLVHHDCFDGQYGTVSNLIIGQEYYIRVFSFLSIPQFLDFTLCIGTIPCAEAISFCNSNGSNQVVTVPNVTNGMDSGFEYSPCFLYETPNASMFLIQTNQAGPINVLLTQSTTPGGMGNIDGDYALYGPFSSNTVGCQVVPSWAQPISCDNSASSTNFFTINAQACEYYILMVFNFSNIPGFISITQTNSGSSGSGQTQCYPYNTFNYSDVTYCQNAPNQTPILVNGATSGIYSSTPSGLDINSITGEINIANSLPGTYVVTNTLSVSGAPTCTNLSNVFTTRNIVITPTPNVIFNYDNNSFCDSDDSQHLVNFSGTLGGQFSATPSGLFINNITGTIIPGFSQPGIYTVTYSLPALGGCPSFSTNTQIEIFSSPISPVLLDVSICNNYILPPLSNGNYFTGSNGTGAMLFSGDVITSSQTIYVLVENGICKVESSFDVNIILEMPVLNILNQPSCINQLGAVEVISPISSTYEYSVDNGLYQTNTIFTGLTPGNHTLIVHDLVNNCFSTPISFTIDPVPYTNSVTDFTYPTPVCITNSTNPMPVLAPGFTSGGTFSYTGTGLDLNSTTGEINLATSTAGTYTVTYNFSTDLTNCINGNSSNFTIIIDPVVTASFSPIANICQNDTSPILPLISNTGVTGTWSPSVINTAVPGTTTYTFTPDPGQCSQVATIPVTINPRVTPTFVQVNTLCVGDAAIILPTTSENNILGSWSPAVVNTAGEGTTVYTFTPDNGECASVVTMSVDVEFCTIQKGISPNGDGLNDFLKLVANKVEIFNRYGKSVYVKTNYNNDWHGQSNSGSSLPTGTYYYVIELISGDIKTGWIYINNEN